MGEIWDKDEVFRLWALLVRTKDTVFRVRQGELSEANISPIKAAVLAIAQATGRKATPGTIANFLFRYPHDISMLIDRMQKEGLVRKVKDLERKNLVRVELTGKGQRAYGHATKRVAIHRVMESLSEKERHQLSLYLEKLRGRALEELGIDNEPYWP